MVESEKLNEVNDARPSGYGDHRNRHL
jgi:hypothetical protein